MKKEIRDMGSGVALRAMPDTYGTRRRSASYARHVRDVKPGEAQRRRARCRFQVSGVRCQVSDLRKLITDYRLLITILLALSPLSTSAQTTDAMVAELKKPVKIFMSGRRTFEGRCSKFTDVGFVLKTYQGGGAIEMDIKASDIVAIQFPGRGAEQYLVGLLAQNKHEDAMELYRLLYNQRRNYFRYIPERQIYFFLGYIQLALDSGDPSLAIAISDKIDDYVKDPDISNSLQDSILVGYHKIGLLDETTRLAKSWLQNAQRYHSSAAGWWVHSENKYKEEDYKGALWISLYPVVFSSQVHMPYLNHCYVIAIASASALKDDAYAASLRAEMKRRKIQWPEDMPQFDFIKNDVPELKIEIIAAPEPKPEPTQKEIYKNKVERNADLPTKTF